MRGLAKTLAGDPTAWAVLALVLIGAVGMARVAARVDDPPTVSAELRARAELAQVADQLAETQAALRACQAAVGPQALAEARKEIAAQRQAIVHDFEVAHPGWTLDPRTLAVTAKPPAKE
jgi:hypothetical protein